MISLRRHYWRVSRPTKVGVLPQRADRIFVPEGEWQFPLWERYLKENTTLSGQVEARAKLEPPTDEGGAPLPVGPPEPTVDSVDILLADSAADRSVPPASADDRAEAAGADAEVPHGLDSIPEYDAAAGPLTDVPKELGNLDPRDEFPWPVRKKLRDDGNPNVVMKPFKTHKDDLETTYWAWRKGQQIQIDYYATC